MGNAYACDDRLTQLLSQGFHLLNGNYIHSSVLFTIKPELGRGNVIGPNCFFGPNVKMGDNNYLHSHVSIGSPPEHKGHWHDVGQGVILGNNIRISSFCTIDSGSQWRTRIDDNCALLSHGHIGHDVIVERDCTISCGAKIGGESTIMRGANVGLNAVIHQRQVIGSYSFIGMGSAVTKKLVVTPGDIFAGNPAKLLGQNVIGLQRAKISDKDLTLEIIRFNSLRGK